MAVPAHTQIGFPSEVLEIILVHLDPITFLSCRRVCKAWCQVVDYLCQTTYWTRLFASEMDTYNPVIQKGILSPINVYKNSLLWKKINQSKVTIVDVVPPQEHRLWVMGVFVNNDEQLWITLRNELLVKNASTFETENAYDGEYAMCVQNRYMVAILSCFKNLHLRPETFMDDMESELQITLDHVLLFKIIKNRCIYITADNRIWEISCKNFIFGKPVSLARWYNSDKIVLIHPYGDNVYFLSQSGKYLLYQNNRLLHVDTFTWTNCLRVNIETFYLLGENNILYSNDSILYVQLKNGKKRDYTNIKEITAILLHGNVLFLGTFDSQIFIYVIKKIEDLLCLQLDNPLKKFRLKELQPIAGLDVFEELNSHTLFVWTTYCVKAIKFNHNF